MPTPTPAAREIYAGCLAKTAEVIGVFTADRSRPGLRQAATEINEYADARMDVYRQTFCDERGIALACHAGCAYCCHGPVHLTPIELLNIVLHLDSSAVSAACRTGFRDRIREKSVRVREMPVAVQMLQTIPCPFLQEGHCGIYAVRPLFCRGRNAVSAAPCRAGYDHPEQPQTFEMVQEQTLVGQCLVMGILGALQQIALTAPCIDLCQGMETAFTTPELVDRWLAGEDSLATAMSV